MVTFVSYVIIGVVVLAISIKTGIVVAISPLREVPTIVRLVEVTVICTSVGVKSVIASSSIGVASYAAILAIVIERTFVLHIALIVAMLFMLYIQELENGSICGVSSEVSCVVDAKMTGLRSEVQSIVEVQDLVGVILLGTVVETSVYLGTVVSMPDRRSTSLISLRGSLVISIPMKVIGTFKSFSKDIVAGT